jgi:hypothetical protein
MGAANAIDTMFPVTQHGFVVKRSDPHPNAPASPSAFAAAAHAADPATPLHGRGESEAPTSSAFRRSFSLLSTSAVSPGPAAAPASGGSASAGPLSPSPLVTEVGIVRPAEHAHLSTGVKRLMKSVVRGLKAQQVRVNNNNKHGL